MRLREYVSSMQTIGLQMNHKELLHLAEQSAINVGSYLLENMHSKKIIFKEEGRDIKLEIDRISEKKIRNDLKNSGIQVLGEEYGGNVDLINDVFWVIDPLDGTSNYFRGIDQCCVSLALMEGKESIIGVIYNFNTKELFSASKGTGAYLNGKKINVSNIVEQDKATLTTGFPSSESLESATLHLSNFSRYKKIRMFGSAALSCAYVAAGRCDVYKEKGIYLWDFAAGICLVEEAGGKALFEKIDETRYKVNFSNGIQ